MIDTILIVHDIRSTHNVGSLLRTADGLGVNEIYLTGYTPYPRKSNDERLPYIAKKIDSQIHKTALGAESTTKWQNSTDILKVLEKLKLAGYQIIALEQEPAAIKINSYNFSSKVALIVGNEITGLGKDVLEKADGTVFIPMLGKKESFNVAQASAIALYHLNQFADTSIK